MKLTTEDYNLTCFELLKRYMPHYEVPKSRLSHQQKLDRKKFWKSAVGKFTFEKLNEYHRKKLAWEWRSAKLNTADTISELKKKIPFQGIKFYKLNKEQQNERRRFWNSKDGRRILEGKGLEPSVRTKRVGTGETFDDFFDKFR